MKNGNNICHKDQSDNDLVKGGKVFGGILWCCIRKNDV